MSLPSFQESGNLPQGIHLATMEEVAERFGFQTKQRVRLASQLRLILDLASGTGKVLRFVVFGSFVTNKLEPNDVDVAIVMDDNFRVTDIDDSTASVFDHQRAQLELDASIFWIRPSHLFLGTMDEFLMDWQVTRENTRRGIVEIQT